MRLPIPFRTAAALAIATPSLPCPYALLRRPIAYGSSASSISMSATSTSTSSSGGSGGGGHTYRYPRPSVTVDTVIFAADPSPPKEGKEDNDEGVCLLLIKRKNPPFEGQHALPGGFVDQDEDLEVAAVRELVEETGLKDVGLAQIGTFGTPGRDPRGWVVTVAYVAFCLLSKEQREAAVQAGDDAAEAGWFPVAALPPLAFDHAEIIAEAWRRVLCEVDKGGRVAVKERGSGKSLQVLEGGSQEGNKVRLLIEQGMKPAGR